MAVQTFWMWVHIYNFLQLKTYLIFRYFVFETPDRCLHDYLLDTTNVIGPVVARDYMFQLLVWCHYIFNSISFMFFLMLHTFRQCSFLDWGFISTISARSSTIHSELDRFVTCCCIWVAYSQSFTYCCQQTPSCVFFDKNQLMVMNCVNCWISDWFLLYSIIMVFLSWHH